MKCVLFKMTLKMIIICSFNLNKLKNNFKIKRTRVGKTKIYRFVEQESEIF